MGELRDSILKQQLQREIDLARKCEAEGKQKEASIHYSKAASLYKMLGYKETARQYEALGEKITEPTDSDEEKVKGLIDSLIVTQKPDTKWEDIGNLEEAKTTLKEAIILPS